MSAAVLWPGVRLGGQPRAQHPTTAPALDVAQLPSLIDGVIQDQMQRNLIPGAAVVLVHGERVLLAKGYGWADVEARRPVDPDRTLYAVGSISKLLSAVAVLRLAEQGKVSLDEPIARYLTHAPSLHPPSGWAVTLGHLLCHTAGLDQRFIGIATDSPADVSSPLAYLLTYRPVWAMPPGRLISYSNDSFAFTGAVISAVTQETFERHMDVHVLAPLGMLNSSFDAPSAKEGDLAVGYKLVNGRPVRLPRLFMRTPPPGGLVATPMDMGRFMMALHARGRGPGGTVLSAASVGELLRQQFTHRPGTPGICLAFQEREEFGVRSLEHGGAWAGMTSKICLVPEHRLGMFISYGLYDMQRIDIPVAVLLERCGQNGPRLPRPKTEMSTDMSQLRTLAGRYRSVSASNQTLERIHSIHDQVVVTPTERGTLRIEGPTYILGEVRPIGQRLFVSTTSEREIEFRLDPSGRVTHLISGPDAFERLAWYEWPALHGWLLVGTGLAFAWVGIIRPVRRWMRHRPIAATDNPGHRSAAEAMGIAVGLLNLAFLLGSVACVKYIPHERLVIGVPPPMVAVLALPLVSLGLATVLALLTAGMWVRRRGALATRLRATMVLAACAALTMVLAYWNGLGYRF